MNNQQYLPRPVAPFNLFPMRTDTGHDGLVLNGCDPKGNCNIPVCIFEESGNAFLHGFTIAEVTEIAASVKKALNNHARLVEALERAIQHVPSNAVNMSDAMSRPISECRTLDFCRDVLKTAKS